jgi:hypothetical protein
MEIVPCFVLYKKLIQLAIPATQEVESWRVMIEGQPGKKLMRPHLNK